MKKNTKIVLSAVFSLIALLLGEDMISDLKAGASIFHMVEEVLVMCLVFVGIFVIWRDNFSLKADLARTQDDLERVRAESLQWIEKNQSLIQGLVTAIDSQMEIWRLSGSEKEIARLLMKGLSMKDIADLRKTSERTVRQQSLAIYTKSSLAGRAELSAFFLEHLLGPGVF